MNSGYSPGEVVPLPEDFRTTKIPLILVLFFRRPPPQPQRTPGYLKGFGFISFK